MIEVLSEKTITVKGRQYKLQLLKDDCIWPQDACDYCYYRDWNDWDGYGPSCIQIHGCIRDEPTYFKIFDL